MYNYTDYSFEYHNIDDIISNNYIDYYSNIFQTVREKTVTSKVRLSVFLIIGECVGLPAVVWALRFLYRRYKSGSRVSAFIITLLLCDLLVLLLNPYIVTKLLQDEIYWERSSTGWIMSSLWSASIISGLHLQQVGVLEAAFTLRHPIFSTHVFFPPCSIIICIIVFIYFFCCELFQALYLKFLAVPLLLVMTLTSWIVTCRTPPHISDTLYRPRKPSFTVLAFVTLTPILYGAFIISDVFTNFDWWITHLNVMFWLLMSLNVIIDPLLCVIISRMSTELNQLEVNT